jgi:hypothetical protein
MFERYTEKARRSIFFARYEASQAGSPVIATEHLLLGVLRENRELQGCLQIDTEKLAERLRTPIVREKVPTAVDLPLDDICKRALAHAAEEADRLNHRHIGSEHLLLGIMREERGRAAQVLRKMGAPTVAEVRLAIVASPPKQETEPPAVEPKMPLPITVVFVDEESGRELSVSPRFLGMPRIGEAIGVAAQGASEHYRVVDVQWKYMEGAQPDRVVLTAVEVRMRKEPAREG